MFSVGFTDNKVPWALVMNLEQQEHKYLCLDPGLGKFRSNRRSSRKDKPEDVRLFRLGLNKHRQVVGPCNKLPWALAIEQVDKYLCSDPGLDKRRSNHY